MVSYLFIVAIIAALVSVKAFAPAQSSVRARRMQPVQENFGFDFAESQQENTLPEMFGEANLKGYVEKYDPEALMIGGPKYKPVQRIRQLQLLKLTAESGLIEALEEKGVTLSQIEKLLPLVDDLGLLPLVSKNKDAVVGLLPLLIEPAPALLPLIVSAIKTPPSTFLAAGVALAGAGAFEATDNVLLGAPLILLGLPLIATGGVLNAVFGVLTGAAPVPKVTPISIDTSSSSSSGPKISAPRVTNSGSGGSQNGRRKTVKINNKLSTYVGEL